MPGVRQRALFTSTYLLEVDCLPFSVFPREGHGEKISTAESFSSVLVQMVRSSSWRWPFASGDGLERLPALRFFMVTALYLRRINRYSSLPEANLQVANEISRAGVENPFWQIRFLGSLCCLRSRSCLIHCRCALSSCLVHLDVAPVEQSGGGIGEAIGTRYIDIESVSAFSRLTIVS